MSSHVQYSSIDQVQEMPSRRKHAKNRHGCVQCKAAHVKCNQDRPSCGLCLRKRKLCSYTSPPAESSHESSSPDKAEAVVGKVANHTIRSTTQQPPSPSSFLDSSWAMQYEDLELLYHYVFFTYTTLADQHELQQMWQTTIPQIAFKFPVLMHSVLGISALHLAHLHPSQKTSRISSAIRHHDITLSIFRHALNHITPSNISALFTSSTLIIVYVFAFPLVSQTSGLGTSTPEIHDPVQEILKIFSLLHGVSIFTQRWSWLEACEVSLLVKSAGSNAESGMSKGARASLFQLQSFVDNASIESDNLSSFKKQIYSTAITSLKQVMDTVHVPHSNKGIVLSWPYMIDSEYERLLTCREPIALIILAHYSVMLDAIKEYWWLRGWGRRLILDIERCLGEDNRWRELISWPLEMSVIA